MRRAMAFLTLWLGLCAPAPLLAAAAADALLAQANAALTRGQPAVARTLAASGLAENDLDPPLRARLLAARGLAYQALGQTEEALLDLTTALHGDALTGEARAQALFARGLTLDAQGRLDLATGDYTAALIFAPGAPYALNNRANVYRRQGRLAEAKRDYTAALEADTPAPEYPWYGLGQIAEVEGRQAAARDFYRRALAIAPDFTLARERLTALGAPAEGAAGLPDDTGIIILKPPPRRESTPIRLKPPPSGAKPSMPGSPPPRPAPVTRVAQTPQHAKPGQGAPLRPAIIENSSGLSVPATGPLVQLGAWRSEAEARAGWTAAQKAAGGLLDGLSPVFVAVTLPGRGTFHRLRVRAPGAGSAFCVALQARGQACLPVRE